MIDTFLFVIDTFYMKAMLILMAVLVAPVMAEDDDGDERAELARFIGGAYKGRGTWVMTSGNNALSDRGCIRKVGNNYFTPEGFYRKVGNTYLKDDEAIVTTGKTFLGDGAVVSTGRTYLGDDRVKVSTGHTILDSDASE